MVHQAPSSQLLQRIHVARNYKQWITPEPKFEATAAESESASNEHLPAAPASQPSRISPSGIIGAQ